MPFVARGLSTPSITHIDLFGAGGRRLLTCWQADGAFAGFPTTDFARDGEEGWKLAFRYLHLRCLSSIMH